MVKLHSLALCTCLGLSVSCSNGHPQNQDESRKVALIGERGAVQIATEDAEKSGFALDRFEITATERPDGWHVEFELKDKRANGGGPSYVLDKGTGKILSKVINQ